jgi:hypothetical protein
MTNVWLHDKRLLDEKNFEIHSRTRRKLTLGDKLATREAYRTLASAPPDSVTLGTRFKIIGTLPRLGGEHGSLLVAIGKLVQAYEDSGERIPGQSMVAAFNFAPKADEAIAVSTGGVDVLFLPEGIYFDPKRPNYEAAFFKTWMGPHYYPPDEKGNERKRMMYRIIVRPRWSRMDKIYRKLKET